MTWLKHVFSLVLAASMLVASAYSEAATIHYDITNAISAQNGYSLSGYFEVAGTGNVTSLSSWDFTATKDSNPTLTFTSAAGSASLSRNTSSGPGVGYLYATDSALYVPDAVILQFLNGADFFSSTLVMELRNNYFGSGSGYSASQNEPPFDVYWNTSSYPVTDANGFQIGSVSGPPSAVPEIDPNSIGSVLALVLGSLGLLERRRLKAA
jgi:hypothetical protein